MEQSPRQLRPLRLSHRPVTLDLPLCKSTLARDLLLEARDGQSNLADLLIQYPTLPLDLRVLIEGLKGGVIDCKDSGTALRFLTVFHAAQGGQHTFTGSERLAQRPIDDLLELLTSCGVAVSRTGHRQLPFTIEHTPPLHTPERIDARQWLSSQYVSALLLSGIRSHIHYPSSSPSYAYVRLTLERLHKHGYILHRDDEAIQLLGRTTTAPPPISPQKIPLQRDWSSASYWYALLALAPAGPSITLPGLYSDSGHPDEVVQAIFADHFGIETSKSSYTIHKSVGHTSDHSPLKLDLSQSPDLFPTIASTCLGLRRPFELSGLSLLRHKESNRIDSFVRNAALIGATGFRSSTSSLIWDGSGAYGRPATIDPERDHRMAMAFGILLSSGAFSGSYSIHSPGVVTKSYPHFWTDLSTLGSE